MLLTRMAYEQRRVFSTLQQASRHLISWETKKWEKKQQTFGCGSRSLHSRPPSPGRHQRKPDRTRMIVKLVARSLPLQSSAGVARMGSMFSSTLYDPTNETNTQRTNPKKLQVRASPRMAWRKQIAQSFGNRKMAQRVADFPDSPVTDANGYASAWWVAGTAKIKADVSMQPDRWRNKECGDHGNCISHAANA